MKDKQPYIVSVIVLTYNQEEWIAQTLDSLLYQKTDYPYEIVIGEDKSTDKTRMICEKYSHLPNVTLLDREKNLGVVGNWVDGVKNATGKYIMVCAGDDYWHNPEKIELQVQFMEKNPDCGLLHTDVNTLHTQTNQLTVECNKTQHITPPQGYIQETVFEGNAHIKAVTCCYRKSILDLVPFDDFLKLHFPIEDWPTQVILAAHSAICYLPISTSTYRIGHASLSNFFDIKKTEQRFEADATMIKYLCNMFPEKLTYNQKKIDQHRYNTLLTTAYKMRRFDMVKKYGKLVDKKSLKKYCSKYWLSYILFALLKPTH